MRAAAPRGAPARGLAAATRHNAASRSRRCVAVTAVFGRSASADPFAPPPTRRPSAPPPAPSPAPSPAPAPQRGSPRWDGTPPPLFQVPAALRAPGAPPCTVQARMVSLESLFPGTGLADAFHANAAFRTALRLGTRADLFVDPGRGAAAAAAMVDPRSTVVLDWRRGTAPDAVCARMDAALAAAGVALRGAELLRRLTALCVAPDAAGDAPAGSLTDIVDNGRTRVTHSWHADSALRVNTVLVGFPPADNHDGAGVFSHVVALSHPLATPPGAARGEVIEWERSYGAGSTEAIPPEYVLRPAFRRGAEVVVYSDAAHLHSAPDYIHREAVWRFM